MSSGDSSRLGGSWISLLSPLLKLTKRSRICLGQRGDDVPVASLWTLVVHDGQSVRPLFTITYMMPCARGDITPCATPCLVLCKTMSDLSSSFRSVRFSFTGSARVLLLSALAGVFACGESGSCGQTQRLGELAKLDKVLEEPSSKRVEIGQVIPGDAHAVFFSTGDALSKTLSSFSESWGIGLCRGWSAHANVDPCEESSLRLLGAKSGAPAALFWGAAGPALVAEATDEAWFEELDAQKAKTAEGFWTPTAPVNATSWPIYGAGATAGELPLFWVSRRAQYWVIAPARQLVFGLSAAPEQVIAQAVEVDEQTSWQANPSFRSLRAELDPAGDAHAFATISLAPLMSGLSADNQDAKTQRDRLIGQIGVLGVRADVAEDHVQFDMILDEDKSEPSGIEGLGEAKGAMPTQLGALVEPGVLGMVRVAFDMNAFIRLIRSSLPASQRLELDELFVELREQFAVDVERDVISNVRGHFVAVVYGVRLDMFEADFPKAMTNLLKFEATREAIYFPIEDRARFARFFDAVTQLSRSKLKRQQVDQTIQYAWMVDGELIWALIVADDHAIYVDSTTAFEHATAHVREPEPLAPGLKKLGVEKLLEGKSSAGAYIDVEGIVGVMGSEWAASALFAPVEKIVLDSSAAGPRRTNIDMSVWFKAPIRPSQEPGDAR